MSMDWLCLWRDAKDDKKLRRLTDHEFRAWFGLLCMSVDDLSVDVSDLVDVADELYLLDGDGEPDEVEAQRIIDVLVRRRLATVEDGVLRLNGIEERNAGRCRPSDSPEAVRERVARHRAAKRSAPQDVTSGNALPSLHVTSNACNGSIGEDRRGEESAPRDVSAPTPIPPTVVSHLEAVLCRPLAAKDTRAARSWIAHGYSAELIAEACRVASASDQGTVSSASYVGKIAERLAAEGWSAPPPPTARRFGADAEVW